MKPSLLEGNLELLPVHILKMLDCLPDRDGEVHGGDQGEAAHWEGEQEEGCQHAAEGAIK